MTQIKTFKLKTLSEQMTLPPVGAPSAEPLGPSKNPAVPHAPALLPAPGSQLSSSDPMSMTVRDFITRAMQVNPLIGKGLESFIQQNGAAFGAEGHKSPVGAPGDLDPIAPPDLGFPLNDDEEEGFDPQAEDIGDAEKLDFDAITAGDDSEAGEDNLDFPKD